MRQRSCCRFRGVAYSSCLWHVGKNGCHVLRHGAATDRGMLMLEDGARGMLTLNMDKCWSVHEEAGVDETM